MGCRRLRRTGWGFLLGISCWGMLFSSCTTLVKVPGGRLDVNDDGVFLKLFDGLVEVTNDRVFVDIPGVRVDVQGDFRHHHGHGDSDDGA